MNVVNLQRAASLLLVPLVIGLVAHSIAAQDRAAGRKRLGKEGNCDLCNVRVDADAPLYTAAEFQGAVRSGLRPPEAVFQPGVALGVPKATLEAGWVAQVMADVTNWACCADCARDVERHLGPTASIPPATGDDEAQQAEKLAVQAALHHRLGDDAKALDCQQRAVALLERQFGPDHPRLAETVCQLGNIYTHLGDYAQAEIHLQRSLRLAQAADPAGLNAAETLSSLGVLYRKTGDFDQAEAMSKKALAIRERLLADDDPDLAMSLNNLAVLYQATGKYVEAEALLRRSKAIAEANGNVQFLAAVLNSLGLVCSIMHRMEEGEKLLLEALSLKESAYGPDHPSVAVTLDNLAGVYLRQSQSEQAAALLLRALEIRRSHLPEDHPAITITLHGLGEVVMQSGDYQLAAAIFQETLDISEARFGPDHPNIAATLSYLGLSEIKRGRHAEGERHLVRSLQIREARFPEYHRETTVSRNLLAGYYALVGRWEEAAQTADQSRRGFRAFSSRILPFLPEAEQLSLAGEHEGAREEILAIAVARCSDPKIATLSAGWVLNGKGVVYEALAERARLLRTAATPDDAASAKELLSVRSRLAALSMQLATESGAAPSDQMATLQQRERELAQQLGPVATDNRERPWVEVDAVRTAMDAESVLIELVRTRSIDFAGDRRGAAHYSAWIIPGSGQGEIRVIDLGDADRIETAVRELRQAMQAAPRALATNRSAADTEIAAPLAQLAELVLRPLETHIAGSSNWIVSPDADLWLVPWCALPLADGSYAVEKHRISYLVSGRDLMSPEATTSNGELVIIADPDFSLTPAELAQESQRLRNNRSDTQLATRSAHELRPWARLPGTAREAEAVAPRLAKYGNATPEVYTGRRALEGVFKGLQRPKVLMLSTHGFFLEDQNYASASGLAGRGAYVSPSAVLAPTGTTAGPIENPLLRCGLVLAGANHRIDDSSSLDDGLLTGLEIVGADLRGTDLVVLSACETGLGHLQNGEGVASLRQSFQLAGARTVVATLWQIPDSETADLMTAYFDYLAEGYSKADALRQAQLTLIASQRQQHGGAHPLFWAGFTVTGDPGTGAKKPIALASRSPASRVPAATLPVSDITEATPPSSRAWILWPVIISLVGIGAMAGGFLLARGQSRPSATLHGGGRNVSFVPPPFVPPVLEAEIVPPPVEAERAPPPVIPPPPPSDSDAEELKLACPCGARLRIKAKWLKKRITCPRCGSVLGTTT
jgi:CHAT domain-containing protein/Tfp pilus assembly protein PilF